MSKELGTLVVVVLKAKNLHDKHSFYKQDPFVQITLDGSTQTTEVDIKGGQHPEWDAEFRFTIRQGKEEKHRMLEIICLRKESRKDEEIGKGKLDISNTVKTGEFDDWIKIEDGGGTYRGEVYLEMTFYAAGPPPLERRPSKFKPVERLSHLNKPQDLQAAGARPQGASQHLKPNPSPPRFAASLAGIPEPVEVVAKVPSILRPGPHASGHRLSGSQSSPPNRSPAVPASLAPGHPAAKYQDGKPSPPFSDRPSYPPYQTPAPQCSIPITNGSPPRQPQHIQNDYSPPAGYHSPPPFGHDSDPFSVHNISIVTTANYNPPSGPVNDYSSALAHVPDSAVARFPTPQIVVESSPPSYPNYSAPPPMSPVQAHSPPHSYHGAYPPTEPSIYPPVNRHPSPSPQAYHYNYRPPPQPQHTSYGSSNDSDPELADPYLLARYTSPLPLPPGKERSPHRPAPNPPTLPASPPQSARNSAVDALEEARKREKEQEEKDLELARQLDRELNQGGT